MTTMQVLYVSKPIVPPWHDGSKNLVRDLAEHVPGIDATVMIDESVSTLSPAVHADKVYRARGSFSPPMAENLRVLVRLLRPAREPLWHFVFAPNPASSSAAKLALGTQRMFGRRPKVVQTVASVPRRFEGVSSLLFGDAVVCQSEHTREALVAAGADPSLLHTIAPCARAPEMPDAARIAAFRAESGLGEQPYVVYPGDLEISSGARTVAAAVAELVALGVRVVFACRPKTPRAKDAQAEIEAALAPSLREQVSMLGTVSDMPALLAGARLVLFPVDDLYGKVDLPLVLLEAMSLGTPVVVAKGGPLVELGAVAEVPPGDAPALVAAARALLAEPTAHAALAEAGRQRYHEAYTPAVVAERYGALYRRLLA